MNTNYSMFASHKGLITGYYLTSNPLQ